MRYLDIGFTAEYQNLFADTEFGGVPCEFHDRDIDYRYYRRPIEGTPYYDIVSPYGYSGPVATGDNPDWENFDQDFRDSCRRHNVIAEFIRLHPFEHNIYDGVRHDLHYEREVFYIDLRQSEDAIWHGFDKGCRGAIKKCDSVPTRWGYSDLFRELYRESMQAKGSAQYAFDDAFFDKADTLASTFYCGAAAAMFLMYGDYCTYFLAATDPGRRNMGHGNLLLWEAIGCAKAQGRKTFILGGGLKANDSLESFKRSFTRTSKHFYTVRRIHDYKAYCEVCQLRGIYESNYFPAYRSWE